MTTEITPTPTAAEAAAIVAAVEALWPKPATDTSANGPFRVTTWRFSGRWWTRPMASRRERPYR